MRHSHRHNRITGTSRIGRLSITFLLVAIAVCAGLLAYTVLLAAPQHFDEPIVVHIEEGMSVPEIVELLDERGVVRSGRALQGLVQVMGDRQLIAGDYVFEEPQTAFAVGQRITRGKFGQPTLRLTIPEGFTNHQIAKRLAGQLSISFASSTFLEEADELEGFLFPNTYTIFPTDTAAEVIDMMHGNFQEQIAPLQDDVAASGHTLEEIIIMASILEEEAATLEDRRKIAGILWERLENDMLLQVDATLTYALGKSTYDLTTTDLATTSVYNTYRYLGLPPAPISNPGLVSIRAALTPIETEYVYYLSDRDGEVYYSVTLDEHSRKKRLYIDDPGMVEG